MEGPATGWRSFAKEFYEDVVCYEDFEHAVGGVEKPVKKVERSHQAAQRALQQRTDAIRAQRERRQQDREEQLISAWEDHLEEQREAKEQQREDLHNRLAREAAKTRRAEQRRERARARVEEQTMTINVDGAFLTEIAESPKHADNVRAPRLPKVDSRLPRRQAPIRGSKCWQQSRQKDLSRADQKDLVAMFPGLKRAPVGQEREPSVETKATRPKARRAQQLRAQIKLMRVLAGSMSVYRREMAAKIRQTADLASLECDSLEVVPQPTVSITKPASR